MHKFSSYLSVYKQIERTDLKAIKESDNNGGRGCKFILILYEGTIGSYFKHSSELG